MYVCVFYNGLWRMFDDDSDDVARGFSYDLNLYFKVKHTSEKNNYTEV